MAMRQAERSACASRSIDPRRLLIPNAIPNMRNPILGSFGVYTLPYRGAGTGVRRALLACPGIQLLNDANLNVFKVTLPRVTPNRAQ